MNVDEGKETAKGGVSLFIVVLVIAVVVSLVMLGLGWFNRGSAKLSDTVNALDSSQFSSYNQAEIKGDQVRSALQSFITQDVVLVVDAQGLYFNGSLGDANEVIITGTDSKACMYNVGLLAKADGMAEDAKGTLVKGTDGKIYAAYDPDQGDQGVLTTKKNMDMTCLQLKRIGTATNQNYIAPGGNYYCTVIYDPSTRAACGVLFSKETGASTGSTSSP